jgi:transketolase
VIGMRSFGASGPIKDVAKKFGFTKEHVAAKARELLDFYHGRAVPNLLDRADAAELAEAATRRHALT